MQMAEVNLPPTPRRRTPRRPPSVTLPTDMPCALARRWAAHRWGKRQGGADRGATGGVMGGMTVGRTRRVPLLCLLSI